MIPVTIISGFLGAGKTTVLRDLVKHLDQKERIAVIVNDFGKVNIDGMVLKDDVNNLIEIQNGCLCCSLNGDFELALKSLVDYKGLDRVIIEPSGIFIIEKMIELFKKPEILNHFYIQSVNVIIDSPAYDKKTNHTFIHQQIKQAGNIVVNKVDLCSDLDRVCQNLKLAAPNANIIVRNDYYPIDDMLVDSFIAADTAPHKSGHSFYSETELLSITFSNKEDIDDYLKSKGGNLVRAKGFVSINDSTCFVSYTSSELRVEKNVSTDTPEHKMVFIYTGGGTVH